MESTELNSYLPAWITDTASVVSIIGFIVTCFLFVEARKIRESFLRKVRIPEIVNDLDRIFTDLSSDLKSYAENKRSAHEKIMKATALLESIVPKLSNNDTDKINSFIANSRQSINDTPNEDCFWRVYSELSGVITYLQQLAKDTRLN